MYNEQSLLKELDALCIKYEYYAHEPLFTVEQINTLQVDIKGLHCKNLFVKNKDGAKWILVINAEERANLKSIAEKLESSRLSFCSAEEMQACLGVIPGSVTPFAIANNSEHNVTLVIDKKLSESEIINCHPLANTATVAITYSDLAKFIKHAGHEITVMNLC